MLRYLRYFMPDGKDEKGKFWYGVGHESYDKYYSFSEWLKMIQCIKRMEKEREF